MHLAIGEKISKIVIVAREILEMTKKPEKWGIPMQINKRKMGK